eukprot:scaffold12371_cov57-Attheya_sp.AAC.2
MDVLADKIQSPTHDVWNQLKNMVLRVNHDKSLSYNLLDGDINDIMENLTGSASKNKWTDAEKAVAYESSD